MFDYYAYLAGSDTCHSMDRPPAGLASGLVDASTVQFGEAARERDQKMRDRKKNEARRNYVKVVNKFTNLALPEDLELDPYFERFPDSSWIGIEVSFTLETPWYSKDDRPFHVLDNPVRKDRVFGVPYMSSASWKGLLRWACQMQEGLFNYLEEHAMSKDGWEDGPWIRHLFGNERGSDRDFLQGALVFYPTWFSKIGFEVINPHNRATRAGTNPIWYEVVPPCTGVLRVLYAPRPGQIEQDGVKPRDVLASFSDAIESLLTCYGFSAKRTAGWGRARIDKWKGVCYNNRIVEISSFQEFKDQLDRLLHRAGQPKEGGQI